MGASENLAQVRELVQAWGYPEAIESGGTPGRGIIITESVLPETGTAPLAAGSPQILLGPEQESAGPGVHHLGLPVRPARLRALLRRLEAELRA